MGNSCFYQRSTLRSPQNSPQTNFRRVRSGQRTVGKKPPEKLSISELLQICFRCHRLAPVCNYNGNTFVTIVKTLLDAELKRLSPDQAHILRSIAGHIVAGTATDIEQKQLDALLAGLEK